MLAYGVNRACPARRESSPNALLLVISAHVALLAVVMSAKMDLPPRIGHGAPLINVRLPPLPPPDKPQLERRQVQPKNAGIDHPAETVQASPTKIDPTVDPVGPFFEPLQASGVGPDPNPTPQPVPPIRVHREPRLLTLAADLRPPYPASKIASEEEATLHLRLSIDDHGAVTAVDPVGPADREFFASARRYIIAHWHYQPASEDGRAVASSLVVTLRFQLDA